MKNQALFFETNSQTEFLGKFEDFFRIREILAPPRA
jgi:hypothetical protein